MDNNRFRNNDAPFIVGLVADLMFAARIRGVASDARTVHSAAALLEVLGPDTRLVLVDAHAPGAAEAIQTVREHAPDATVIAFGAHVETGTLRSAREAGAHRVMARSGFVRELPALVEAARRGGRGKDERPPRGS